jgi:hypothetical protein
LEKKFGKRVRGGLTLGGGGYGDSTKRSAYQITCYTTPVGASHHRIHRLLMASQFTPAGASQHCIDRLLLAPHSIVLTAFCWRLTQPTTPSHSSHPADASHHLPHHLCWCLRPHLSPPPTISKTYPHNHPFQLLTPLSPFFPKFFPTPQKISNDIARSGRTQRPS